MNSQLNSSEAKGDDDFDVSFRKEHENTPVTHVVNLSVEPSVVPATWKVGVARSIFKTDKHHDRPINILPLVLKVIE